MSLEQRLFANAMKSAHIGDIRGYGLNDNLGESKDNFKKNVLSNYTADVLSEAKSADMTPYGGKKPKRKYTKRGNKQIAGGDGPISGSMLQGEPYLNTALSRSYNGDVMSGGSPLAIASLLLPAAINIFKEFIKGSGLSGGDAREMLSREVLSDGDGLSGGISSGGMYSGGVANIHRDQTYDGYSLGPGYGSRYPGSFPMPGFSPPPDGWQGYGNPGSVGYKPVMQPMGNGLSGGLYSGGNMQVKKPESDWIKSCKKYMKENNCQLKDAMIALKRS